MSSENKKREQAEKLLRAIGEIDDRFLLQAMEQEETSEFSGKTEAENSVTEMATQAETAGQTADETGQTSETGGKVITPKRRLRRYSTWALTAAACLTVVIIGRYVSVNSVKSTEEQTPTAVVQEKQTDAADAVREKAGEADAAKEEGGTANEADANTTAQASSQSAGESAFESKDASSSPLVQKASEAAGAGSGVALTIPNPFVDTKTLKEAEKEAGFSITLPEDPKSDDTQIYRAMKDQMLEVIYMDDDNREVYRVRKGKDMEDDISGVYFEHPVSKTLESGDLKITVSGEEKDQWNVAVWTAEDEDGTKYSYSICSGQDFMDEDEIIRMAAEMMKES